MSPYIEPKARTQGAKKDRFKYDLNLSIVGLGVEYPPFHVGPEGLEILAKKFYPADSKALKKVLAINRFTGIEHKSTIGDPDHPLVNQPTAPSIKDLNTHFKSEGVRLSVAACRKAIAEYGGSTSSITHLVSTTCTNSANPGFDHYVAKQLGLSKNVEKILLHGIGCSGGLAALRTAANAALGHSYRGIRARVLVLACEISSVLVRSELDSVVENDEVRIGACLFSDCASACVVSNGVGRDDGDEDEEEEEEDGEDEVEFDRRRKPQTAEPIFDILGWRHEVIADSEDDLGFDVDPLGWKVILTQRVPALAAASVAPTFKHLLNSIPSLASSSSTKKSANGESNIDKPLMYSPTDFDWALHPGGSTILTGVEKAMGLTPEHLYSSYDVYINHGNSSSATVFSVMDNIRRREGEAVEGSNGTHVNGNGNGTTNENGDTQKRRKNVVACAFGPGINVEMAMLRKRDMSRRATFVDVEDSGSSSTMSSGEMSVESSPMDTPPAEPLD